MDFVSKTNKLNNAVSVVLWALFVYCMIHVTVSLSNVPKFFYFYIGASSFIGIILLIRKVQIFKWYIIVPIIAFFGNVLYFYFIHRHEYGYQYIAMLLAKYIMFAMFAVVIVDEIKRGNRTRLDSKNIVFCFLFFLAIIVTVILGHDYILPIICPITALYISDISESTWVKMFYNFSLSSYLVVYIYSIASFIIKPNEYVAGRYWGVFNFPVVGALLGALGLICGVYLWLNMSKRIVNRWFKIITLIIFLIYPSYLILITMDRAVIIGLISVLIFSSVLLCGKNKNLKKRLILATIIIIFIAVVFGLAVLIVYKMDDSTFENISSKISIIPGGFATILRFVSRFKYGSEYSYFPQGTLLNGIDYFTSYRLGLWYLASKEVRLLGDSPITFVIRDIEYHTHNTYVEWFLRVGLVGGSLLSIWIITYLIVAIRKMVTRKTSYLLGFWWITFCLPFMMVERELWIELPLFLLLVFQYPYIIKMDEMME